MGKKDGIDRRTVKRYFTAISESLRPGISQVNSNNTKPLYGRRLINSNSRQFTKGFGSEIKPAKQRHSLACLILDYSFNSDFALILSHKKTPSMINSLIIYCFS